MKRVIGVLDSGVGGLSVLRELSKYLSNVDLIYFADSARCPYGVQSKEAIQSYTIQILNFFVEVHHVSAVVIACNTATIAAIDVLKKRYDIPIIGVVDFAIEEALKVSENRNIGLMATYSTVNSQYYHQKITFLDDSINFSAVACPNLVVLIEAGIFNGSTISNETRNYLKSLLVNNVDTIILGCTHFPLIRELIQELVGPNIKLVDPAIDVALYLKDMFVSEKDNLSSISFYSSALENLNYQRLVKDIFMLDVPINYIDITKF